MDEFAHKFADFAASLTTTRDFDDTAEHLINYAVSAVGAGFGGITLLRPRGQLETIGATDRLVEELDAAQYELRQGPCVDAATEARSSVSGSLDTDPRWPVWGPEAASRGVLSILSAEIHSHGQRIGALNVYGHGRDVFSVADVELAGVLAIQAAPLMAVLTSEAGLRQALETRTLIGQAQGMLMERFGIQSEQAFSVLRRYSQDTNTRLSDVAEQVVTSRDLP